MAALVTGVSIAFILTVFQPFGTVHFKHDYKFWILSGYGIVAGFSICLYYYLSISVINKKREAHWTIIHESFDLFLSMLIGLLMCYFYFIVVFGHSLNFSGMMAFLIRAGSVSILPVLGLYAYLFNQYRDLKRSTIEFDTSKSPDKHRNTIKLRGSNKVDIITTREEDIIYIKAEDNYVILHILKNDATISRHMIRSTMKKISSQLSTDIFISCHRSYIINKEKINSISGNKNDTKVSLKYAKKPIPVSRGKVEQIRSLVAKVNL